MKYRYAENLIAINILIQTEYIVKGALRKRKNYHYLC